MNLVITPKDVEWQTRPRRRRNTSTRRDDRMSMNWLYGNHNQWAANLFQTLALTEEGTEKLPRQLSFPLHSMLVIPNGTAKSLGSYRTTATCQIQWMRINLFICTFAFNSCVLLFCCGTVKEYVCIYVVVFT
ncbi:hypothetical protein E2C01_085128 [Portunus trituberculatus]|uniref:Uncharacterized protein n=1 Tax=Portunus trituberculatus TaxID=210409 RepID=A0A5B7J5V0_PORTR|nr:hypothetical protein [Portunus trituberculatus]